MPKKVVALLIAAIFMCGCAFAMCGMCESQDANASEKGKSEAVNVNNAICPVTGEAVDIKNPVTAEYKGKSYNLCCPSCIKAFNSDPEKYSAKVK